MAIVFLTGDRTGGPGSYVGDVTGVELALLVEVTDFVNDAGGLGREGVVGEGGDPGSADSMDRADVSH